MKRSVLLILMCLICLFLWTGCGNASDPSTASAPSASGTPDAFGETALADTPVQEAATTTLPEDQTAGSSQPESASVSSEEASGAVSDYTEQAVIAAIICAAVDTLPYAPEDSMYLWRGIGYLIGQIGTQADIITQEGEFGHIAAEDAAIFAYAIDADFDGNIPSTSEEDPLIGTAEDGGYLINMLDQGALSLSMTENRLSSDADTVTEEAELFRDGESLGVYTVTLTKYANPDGPGRNYFAYSITDITPAA